MKENLMKTQKRVYWTNNSATIRVADPGFKQVHVVKRLKAEHLWYRSNNSKKCMDSTNKGNTDNKRWKPQKWTMHQHKGCSEQRIQQHRAKKTRAHWTKQQQKWARHSKPRVVSHPSGKSMSCGTNGIWNASDKYLRVMLYPSGKSMRQQRSKQQSMIFFSR